MVRDQADSASASDLCLEASQAFLAEFVLLLGQLLPYHTGTISGQNVTLSIPNSITTFGSVGVQHQGSLKNRLHNKRIIVVLNVIKSKRRVTAVNVERLGANSCDEGGTPSPTGP